MARDVLGLPSLIFLFAIILYTYVSKIIFDEIFLTSNIIVDEEFHLPLGSSYCLGDFNTWDPKVTTLPGLYLLSAFIFGSRNLCTTYWLRLVPFGSSVLNVILFYFALNVFNYREVAWKHVITALNLAILPPLYFFSHVYYTDVSSITMSLLCVINAKRGRHYLAANFGFFAIIMRQTNVIWVIMVFGEYLLRDLYLMAFEYPNYMKHVKINFQGVLESILHLLNEPVRILKRIDLQFFCNFLSYLFVIVCFGSFVVINGSIVVGDKRAHEATIHIPQLFYFATFTLIFAWPHFIDRIIPFLKFAWKNKSLMLISIILCLLIVRFNTIVHPYMLADNRHYTFYVWNRFYGRYPLFRFGMVFIYIFAIYGIISKIYDKNDMTYSFMYILCTVVLLSVQKMIEVRYFLFPFILFRIQLKNTQRYVLLLETLTYFAVNAVTLYIFFTKHITWDNYDYPQRLIW